MTDTAGKTDPTPKSEVKVEETRANDLDMQILAQDFLKGYKKKRASAKGSITKIIKNLRKNIYFGGSKEQVSHEMKVLHENYDAYEQINASLYKYFDEKNPDPTATSFRLRTIADIWSKVGVHWGSLMYPKSPVKPLPS